MLLMYCQIYFNMALIKKEDIISQDSLNTIASEVKRMDTLCKQLAEDTTKLTSYKVKIQGHKLCEYCNTKVQSSKTNCVNCGAPN